jgi:hypothetical protein
MNYNETDADSRKLAVYLVDSSGTPVTGFVPASGELQVSLSGSALANGGGIWTEIGSGFYTYEATQAETQTYSFLALVITNAGIKTFVWTEDIGTRIAEGETDSAYLRIPLYLLLADGITPATGLDLSIDVTSRTSINAVAFGVPPGSFTEIGSGLYYYQADSSEVSNAGVLIVLCYDASITTFAYSQTITAGLTTSGPTGESGYFGSYFGTGDNAPAAVSPVVTPTPIPVPVVAGDAEYVDHAEAAVNRLPEYAKSKST